MSDKEKLMRALLQDMKHWSSDTFRVALNFIDGKVLSQTGEDFLWWWELRKQINKELERMEAAP